MLVIIVFIILPIAFGGQQSKVQRERENNNKPKKYPR